MKNTGGKMKKKVKLEKISRKKYLVSPSFQIKYVGIMLSTVLVTSLFIGAGVYFTLMAVVNKSLPSVDEQKMFADVVFAQANQLFLISMPVIIVAVVLVSIFLSHKISGPEYRIKRILEGMVKRDFSADVMLRKGDELQTLAYKIDDVNHSLSSMIKEQKRMVAILDSKINLLAKEAKKSQPSKTKLVSLAGDLSENAKNLKKDFESIKILNA